MWSKQFQGFNFNNILIWKLLKVYFENSRRRLRDSLRLWREAKKLRLHSLRGSEDQYTPSRQIRSHGIKYK